jgi:hypothetical protein
MRAATPWLAFALIVVTAAVFAPSLLNGFVDWDDEINITRNVWFRGWSAAHVHWMLTNTLMGHYIPVTWISFALDHAIWGMNPFGYHLANVVLHALNAALVFLIALRLLAYATVWPIEARRLAAGIATLFFAWHPLRAESVAWVTERRDVLSGFFFLLSVLGYLAAQERSGRARRLPLIASIVAFGLALLSKSIVMGLPLVLFVLDVYPLRRITLSRAGLAAGWHVVMEKIPYAILGIAGAAVAYYGVHSNQFLTPMEAYPWPARVAMAFYSFWFYVATTAMPIGLSPLYELPASLSPVEPRFLGPMLGVTAITAVAFAMRRRRPALLAVWLSYAIILGPVSGIVHSGFQLAHDRYSYLSCIGCSGPELSPCSRRADGNPCDRASRASGRGPWPSGSWRSPRSPGIRSRSGRTPNHCGPTRSRWTRPAQSARAISECTWRIRTSRTPEFRTSNVPWLCGPTGCGRMPTSGSRF